MEDDASKRLCPKKFCNLIVILPQGLAYFCPMSHLNLQMIETASVLVLLILVLYINKRAVNNALKKLELGFPRRKMIIKVINGISLAVALIVLAAVWGVNHSQIVVFLTSFITVMGIAFFAQWSLLSNITSGIILFFNHPLHIGDQITVYDKDFPIEGKIIDITYFFVHIRMADRQILTIPNSVILQKMISVKTQEKTN